MRIRFVLGVVWVMVLGVGCKKPDDDIPVITAPKKNSADPDNSTATLTDNSAPLPAITTPAPITPVVSASATPVVKPGPVKPASSNAPALPSTRPTAIPSSIPKVPPKK